MDADRVSIGSPCTMTRECHACLAHTTTNTMRNLPRRHLMKERASVENPNLFLGWGTTVVLYYTQLFKPSATAKLFLSPKDRTIIRAKELFSSKNLFFRVIVTSRHEPCGSRRGKRNSIDDPTMPNDGDKTTKNERIIQSKTYLSKLEDTTRLEGQDGEIKGRSEGFLLSKDNDFGFVERGNRKMTVFCYGYENIASTCRFLLVSFVQRQVVSLESKKTSHKSTQSDSLYRWEFPHFSS